MYVFIEKYRKLSLNQYHQFHVSVTPPLPQNIFLASQKDAVTLSIIFKMFEHSV